MLRTVVDGVVETVERNLLRSRRENQVLGEDRLLRALGVEGRFVRGGLRDGDFVYSDFGGWVGAQENLEDYRLVRAIFAQLSGATVFAPYNYLGRIVIFDANCGVAYANLVVRIISITRHFNGVLHGIIHTFLRIIDIIVYSDNR